MNREREELFQTRSEKRGERKSTCIELHLYTRHNTMCFCIRQPFDLPNDVKKNFFLSCFTDKEIKAYNG